MRTFTVQLCCALLLVAWTSTAERRETRVISSASHIHALNTHREERSSNGDAAFDEGSLPTKTRRSENSQESGLPYNRADDTHTTSKKTIRSRRTRRTASFSTIVATVPAHAHDRGELHTTAPGDHSEAGRAENSSSWHAHIHVDQLFNTSSELSEIAYSETKFFLDKIFNKYGASSSMTLPDLTRLIQNLGLSAEEHDDDPDAIPEAGSDVTSGKSRRRKKSVTHVHSNHSDCHFITDLLWAFHFDSLTTLDTGHFLLLCPALIDQLDNGDCHRHHRHHHHQNNHHHDNSDHDTVALDSASIGVASIPAHAWLYSFVAVLVISLVGLLGVAVIPLMRKLFYKRLLQFLISLAVGALSGDALLHLLPHALEEEGDNHGAKEGHSSNSVWKGLVALVALVFFFVLERVLHVVTSQRAKRRQKKKITSKISALANDNGTNMMSPLVLTVLPGGQSLSNEISVREKGIIGDEDNIHDSYISATADDAQHSNQNHSDPGGHGHGHAHLSEMPDSVAAIAWMVILGDGIHNFSDGLAIGAAFANSITGGFSTSVAVFCHELPHEIGDFAVLLSSGMTAKQGLAYNVLSSALCFMGMVAGMLLGQVKSASIWVFAAVGGMFLYISLADMLPQLSTAGNQSGKAACKNLLVQCLGIVLGAAIMLTIAVFEEDLKNMLD